MSHPVFSQLEMKDLSYATLEDFKNQTGLKVLFLWGYNCPNCEIAKASLSQEVDLIKKFNIEWYHCNVYEDFDVSTHFGLHGIPVFIFYNDAKNLGRVTSFPGMDAFLEVLKKLTIKA